MRLIPGQEHSWPEAGMSSLEAPGLATSWLKSQRHEAQAWSQTELGSLSSSGICCVTLDK